MLVFSKEVNCSILDLSDITFYSEINGGRSYALTGGSGYNLNSTTIFAQLTTDDVVGIQSIDGLAISQDTTYLTVVRGLVSDLGTVPLNGLDSLEVVPISLPDALPASNFTGDSALPTLVSFELSLNGNDPLVLTFSEAIIASTLLINRFALVSARSSPETFRFTNATVLSPNGAVIEVRITAEDKQLLQQMPNIGTNVNNTFFIVSLGAVQDTDTTRAVQASRVIPDTLPPNVFDFNLDMNLGILTLYADEPIDGNTFNPAAFTLQNTVMNPSAFHTLSTNTRLDRVTDFTILTVTIHASDLNAIKARRLCTSFFNYYLTYVMGGIADTNGQLMLNQSFGFPPSVLINDTTNPRFVSFDNFNSSSAALDITFSETIDSSSFNPSGVILQSLFSGGADVTMYRLTGGSVSNNSVSVTITLEDEDVDNIVLSPFLCTTRGNCYLSLTAEAFSDIAENSLVPVSDGRLGQVFVPDNIPPQLTDFEVNLEASTLILTFSEVVSTVAFNARGITLQSDFNSSDGYTL